MQALQKGWLVFADTSLKCVQITKSFFTMHENKQMVEARASLCLSGSEGHLWAMFDQPHLRRL